MKLLHMLKSEPDDITQKMIDILSEEQEAVTFALYENGADYEKLVDMIFEYDKIISWW